MVRILLVDDHPLVRRGLRAEIEVHEGMQVVAEAETTVEALERLALDHPNVAVIDVRLGDGCGIDLGRYIVAQSPCATVLLTAFDWDVYLVRAWEAGVGGRRGSVRHQERRYDGAGRGDSGCSRWHACLQCGTTYAHRRLAR